MEDDKNKKMNQLEQHTERKDKEEEVYLTTNQGVRVNHTDDSLKAGERGPTLMEDFHFREKMTHFDHERIPERVVHARGSAAHGVFSVYEDMSWLTRAKFLSDPSSQTPVFVRFSTVVGFRGSADTVRDVRGFATKFYTGDGIFDLVGNNMPVFFIQDGIKFPDLVHAIKPEPHNEMPQASAAHDNFWDFISLMPESMHMIMWVLSDRALPRSYAMMEGFGIHTFRMINAEGKSRFVKFHWKPLEGMHSLVWDETQKLAGKDPDFNRRDLWERIEMGDFPEYELGVQIVEEEDEHAFAFDLLDPTKIIPEELVPVKIIGKMTLNRNPDNFFAETEQVAFHPGDVVSGIDFTNDPLLQARLFSYIDTQLTRLGGPNFAEIPINRPLTEVHNNQRDGFMRQTINKGRVNYFPNSLAKGCPMMAPESMQGFVHHMERVQGHKVRGRSESFRDFYSQATLFWNSITEPEKKHIVEAFHFELGKLEVMEVRERMVDQIAHIDGELANMVAEGIGVNSPSSQRMEEIKNELSRIKAQWQGKKNVDKSPALSMEINKKTMLKGRKVAFLVEDGYDHQQLMTVKEKLMKEGAGVEIISKIHGTLKAINGEEVKTGKTHLTTASIMYDAVFIPGGKDHLEKLVKQGDVLHFVNEAFKHCKPIAAVNEGVDVLENSQLKGLKVAGDANQAEIISDVGVVTVRQAEKLDDFCQKFIASMMAHRHWTRAEKEMVPA